MRACKTMCAFPGAVGWSEVHVRACTLSVPAWACMGRISRLTMLDLTCASAQPRFRTPKWRPSTLDIDGGSRPGMHDGGG